MVSELNEYVNKVLIMTNRDLSDEIDYALELVKPRDDADKKLTILLAESSNRLRRMDTRLEEIQELIKKVETELNGG